MLTTTQIENKFDVIDNKIKGIATQLERLNFDLTNKVNFSDLNRNIEEVRELIRAISDDIQKINERLSKILLPEETRYYLNEGEVSSFQANFNTLKAMMTKFDKLYKNLVNYQTNLTSNT